MKSFKNFTCTHTHTCSHSIILYFFNIGPYFKKKRKSCEEVEIIPAVLHCQFSKSEEGASHRKKQEDREREIEKEGLHISYLVRPKSKMGEKEIGGEINNKFHLILNFSFKKSVI